MVITVVSYPLLLILA